jgi:hypothetical protein
MNDESLENDLLCSICLDNLDSDNRNITETICNHIFHNECLNLWLNNNSTCPCCRTAINDLEDDTSNLHEIEPINNTDIYNFINYSNNIFIDNNNDNNNNIINNDNIMINTNIINYMINRNINNILINDINNIMNNNNNLINNNDNIINYMINENMNNIYINDIINNINNFENINYDPIQ